jgi:hypothetical protein
VLDALIRLFTFAPTSPLIPAMVAVLMRSVILAHRLLEYLPDARPLINLVGPPGSGKTSVARIVGRVVNPEFQITSVPANERDFWVLLAQMRPAVLDNVERAPSWFPDAVAAATAGASRPARKLYSDSALVQHRAASMIWMTSFSGGAFRGDLLDRSLIFRLGVPSERFPDAWLKNRLDVRRTEIEVEFTNVMIAVHERARAAYPTIPPSGSGRLADFAILGHLVADVCGGEPDAQLFDAAMALMAAERVALACDANPLFSSVVQWAIHRDNRDEHGAPIWVSAQNLVRFIADVLGGTKAFDGTTRDAVKLGRFLSDLALIAAGLLKIETKTIHGTQHYRVTAAFDVSLLSAGTESKA